MNYNVLKIGIYHVPLVNDMGRVNPVSGESSTYWYQVAWHTAGCWSTCWQDQRSSVWCAWGWLSIFFSTFFLTSWDKRDVGFQISPFCFHTCCISLMHPKVCPLGRGPAVCFVSRPQCWQHTASGTYSIQPAKPNHLRADAVTAESWALLCPYSHCMSFLVSVKSVILIWSYFIQVALFKKYPIGTHNSIQLSRTEIFSVDIIFLNSYLFWIAYMRSVVCVSEHKHLPR